VQQARLRNASAASRMHSAGATDTAGASLGGSASGVSMGVRCRRGAVQTGDDAVLVSGLQPGSIGCPRNVGNWAGMSRPRYRS
jgi:hypothetical protein